MMLRAKGTTYFVLSLVGFVVLVGTQQVQAAWTKTETSRIKQLEKRVQDLEVKLANRDLKTKTIKFLAIRGNFRVCPGDAYPILDFPFNPGQGYYVPARMSDYGNFNDTIQLIACAVDIVQEK